MAQRDADEEQRVVDLLLQLLLDDLAPAVEAYRRVVARRLGLEPVDLLCLDVVRRVGETPSSALTAWTGLSRSALSKSLRRLEDAGHLARSRDELTNGEVLLAVRPHDDRDRLLAEMRVRVGLDVRGLVVDHALTRPALGAAVAGWTTTMATSFLRVARGASETDARRTRRRERDRREARRRTAVEGRAGERG